MFDLLANVYDRSEDECDISISFRPTRGEQQNDCRDLLMRHLEVRELETARDIAERLRDNTDRRSGLGLLFLIAGMEGRNHKIVISRFPTDSAIFVDEDSRNFTVQFLERVFMKNKLSYKAVVYRDRSLRRGFWDGLAIDKQINSRGDRLSDYWIADFLLSDFVTTPAHGSRRLGEALRNAVKNAPVEVKEELIATATLASRFAGEVISIEGLTERLHLSPATRQAIEDSLKNQRLAREHFRLDVGELRKYIAYRSVELDNGALLTAGSASFEDVFRKRYVDRTRGEVEYSTQGKIIDEKLKPQR